MTTPQQTASATRHRPRWIAPVAIMVIAAAGMGVGLVVANDDDRTDVSSGTQIANVEQACQNWMSSDSATEVPGEWCRNMGRWMSRQLADGDMGESMMWGNQSRMLQTCRRWERTEPAPTTDHRSCDDMVAWMNDHKGADWDNWTMRGPMLGR